jgi:hypothetical protein
MAEYGMPAKRLAGTFGLGLLAIAVATIPGSAAAAAPVTRASSPVVASPSADSDWA